MIFGWLEHGVTDRWVLVDPLFPWPALHHGRAAMRTWADHHSKARALDRTPGPRRMPWPCQTAVKEDGAAELRIWPVMPFGYPRAWTEADRVWRPAMDELGAVVAAAIGCDVTLLYQAEGLVIERATTSPDLAGRGFIGWGRGERAPSWLDKQQEPPGDLKMRVTAADLNIMPQGDKPWH